MRFLKLRTAKTKKRKCGTAPVLPILVDAPRRYAHHTERREQFLSVRRCQLITGAHDSGKSRWLLRMHDKWLGIWGSKSKHPPLFLSALHPLSSWTDNSGVAIWYDEQKKLGDSGKFYADLNQQQKADLLPDYALKTGAVVFVDDAHKLTGRKMQIARTCVINARIWVISASQENRLPPNLRPLVERREPQRTRLASDASYDATSFVIWGLIVAALGIGWWEAGLILGGLKMLGTGRRSARPD